MNRNEIKGIVKECLIEILMEGVGNPSERISENRTQRKVATAPQPTPPVRKSHLDTVTYAQRTASVPKPPVRAQQKDSYRELANGNEVMASIFADTASTTLMEQRESVGAMAAHSSANPVIDTGVDPTMFDGSRNWEALAFSEKRPGQSHR